MAPFDAVIPELVNSLSGDTRIVYLASAVSAVTYERLRAYNPAGKLGADEEPYTTLRVPSSISDTLRRTRAEGRERL